ncbi:MAG: hypothetical protein GF387_00385 [Candidatus Portnoybacteria bacterium]|nr:hypothetical protein [Candidatus Portnoybacteria bacterium]
MRKNYLLMIVLIVMFLFPAQAKGDSAMVNLYPEKVNLWYFHCPPEGVNFYFLNVWPDNFLLVKLGPPAFKITKGLSIQVAAGPDLIVKAEKFEGLFNSFTIDIVPTISNGHWFAFLVNEVGINKGGKPIHFLRHTLTYKGVGVRMMTSGTIGEDPHCLLLGPVFNAGKVQFWMAKDIQNKEWQMEFALSFEF